MNTKTAWGVLALVVVIAGAYWGARYVRPAPTTTPLEVFQSTGTSSSGGGASGAGGQASAKPSTNASQPTFVQGAPVKHIVHITLAFSAPTYTTTERFPTFEGTGGNLTSATVLIKNSDGVGIEEAQVAIVNGRWSYSSARALDPGNYTVLLGNKDLVVVAKLTVE